MELGGDGTIGSITLIRGSSNPGLQGPHSPPQSAVALGDTAGPHPSAQGLSALGLLGRWSKFRQVG